MWQRQVPRVLGFGLMLVGLALAVRGRTVEANSFRSSPSIFEGGLSSEDRARERLQASDLKTAGVVLVLGGPAVWLLGWLVLQERIRAEPSAAPDRGRLAGSARHDGLAGGPGR